MSTYTGAVEQLLPFAQSYVFWLSIFFGIMVLIGLILGFLGKD